MLKPTPEDGLTTETCLTSNRLHSEHLFGKTQQVASSWMDLLYILGFNCISPVQYKFYESLFLCKGLTQGYSL